MAMRQDMAKVLVESPRGGWRVPRRTGRAPAPEESPRFENLSRGRTKWFGEHLGPLKKYLNRQVGRPWNKVFSEMRERIKPGNTVQEHILTHIDCYLVRDAERVTPTEQAPCGVRRRPHERRAWRGGAIDEGMLFVDPDSGLILRARRKLKGPPPTRARKHESPRRLDDGRVAFVSDGVWRAVSLVPYALTAPDEGPTWFEVGRNQVLDACWDPALGMIRASDHQKLRALAEIHGPGVIPVRPQRVSARDRRRYRLKNIDD